LKWVRTKQDENKKKKKRRGKRGKTEVFDVELIKWL